MAVAIKTIDKIAREKNEAVLILDFGLKMGDDYIKCKHRDETIQWLKDNNIRYECVLPFTTKMLFLGGYFGHLYLDIPLDEDNELFKLVDSHFCNDDTTAKIAGVDLGYIPLEQAMQIAEQDDASY